MKLQALLFQHAFSDDAPVLQRPGKRLRLVASGVSWQGAMVDAVTLQRPQLSEADWDADDWCAE